MKLSRTASLDSELTVNVDSGEIIEAPDKSVYGAEIPEHWSTRDKEQFFKCESFVQEIVIRKLDLTKNEQDRNDIIDSFKKFGEQGKHLWIVINKIGEEYSNKKINSAKIWDDYEGEGAKTPSKFFAICKHYEITTAALNKKATKMEDVELPAGVDKEDYYRYGFYEKDTTYYSIGKDGPRCVAEFVIRVLYLVKSKSNPKRIVEIKNQHGYKEVLDMPTDVFSSLGTFKKAVESVGPYVFEGNDTDLTRLKKKLFREEKESIEIYSLGYFKRGNFYSFANGIYAGSEWLPADEYGIVEYQDKNYFLPFTSKIYSDDDEEYVNEKKFRYKPSKKPVKVEDWMNTIQKVYGPNGLIGVCFYLASIFRDILFDIDSNFPMLFCFGQRQSGKTTFMHSFKLLFGEPQDSISLENPSSIIGTIRTLSRFYNIINCLDEYKNTLDKKAIGMLKGIYDGMGRTTGKMSNDNQTKTTKPNSAVICGGQEMPTLDNALFTRFFQLEFYAKNRNEKAFEELKAIEKRELIHITLDMMKHRSNIQEQALEVYKKWRMFFKDAVKEYNMDDRMIHNAAIMITPYAILSKIVKEMPYDVLEVANVIIEAIKTQHNKIKNSTDGSKFWDIFQALVRQGQLKEGSDYRFKENRIIIRVANIYSFYAVQYRHEMNTPGLDKQTLLYYLEHTDEFITKDKLKFDTGEYDGQGNKKQTTTSCHVFDYKKLNLEIFSEE